MFIRFSTVEIDEKYRRAKGIFMCAGDLLDSRSLHPVHEDYLNASIQRFNKNLPVPKSNAIDPRAIFWFQTSASDLIKKIWELANFLDANGCLMNHIVCARPGKVIYADNYQVAAIPFNELKSLL